MKKMIEIPMRFRTTENRADYKKYLAPFRKLPPPDLQRRSLLRELLSSDVSYEAPIGGRN